MKWPNGLMIRQSVLIGTLGVLILAAIVATRLTARVENAAAWLGQAVMISLLVCLGVIGYVGTTENTMTAWSRILKGFVIWSAHTVGRTAITVAGVLAATVALWYLGPGSVRHAIVRCVAANQIMHLDWDGSQVVKPCADTIALQMWLPLRRSTSTRLALTCRSVTYGAFKPVADSGEYVCLSPTTSQVHVQEKPLASTATSAPASTPAVNRKPAPISGSSQARSEEVPQSPIITSAPPQTTAGKTSQLPEQTNIKVAGKRHMLLLVAENRGDVRIPAFAPYYISFDPLPIEAFVEYAETHSVRSARPKAEVYVRKIYPDDARGLAQSLGGRLPTVEEWINAHRTTMIDDGPDLVEAEGGVAIISMSSFVRGDQQWPGVNVRVWSDSDTDPPDGRLRLLIPATTR